jgi:NTE family protein
MKRFSLIRSIRARSETDSIDKERSKTIFVLGGGGGKGACQVGMLIALIEQGILADMVIGVSVGALNGAVYATNPTLDGLRSLENLWESLDKDTIMPKRKLGTTWRYAQRAEAVYPGEGLQNLIDTYLDVSDISDTKIPLEVLAADYSTGEEIWFGSGEPRSVLYASAAIPGVFPPLRLDNRLLVDGGIVNDTPIDRAVYQGATHIYMLLCGTPYAQLPDPKRPLEALIRSSTHTKTAHFRHQIAHLPSTVSLTVLDCPEASGIEALDFSKKSLLLRCGYELAHKILAQETQPSFSPPAPQERTSPTDITEKFSVRGPMSYLLERPKREIYQRGPTKTRLKAG